MKIIVFQIIIMLILTTQVYSQSDKTVTYQVESKSMPINYDSLKLYGLLGERMDLNIDKVLAILPYYSYTRAYTPGVEAYWPVGEYLGKFAQALMNSYRYNGNQHCLEQTQKNNDNWVDAHTPDAWEQLILTPFTVAGQNGSIYRVWMPDK